MSLERAVLRHPVEGVREWLAFADPVDSWEADELSDVKDVLDAAEAAMRPASAPALRQLAKIP